MWQGQVGLYTSGSFRNDGPLVAVLLERSASAPSFIHRWAEAQGKWGKVRRIESNKSDGF